MASNKLRVWWLTEEECKAIGFPYNSSDSQTEAEVIEEGRSNPQWVDLAQLPWPDYVKVAFNDLWGEGPRGALYFVQELAEEAQALYQVEFENPRLVERCSHASGIVIRAKDAMTVLPYGGFMTDENGRYSA